MTETDVAEGIDAARAFLESSILAHTVKDLSPTDLRFLQAMTEDGSESNMADLTSRLGVTSAYAGQYRLRLMNMGVISSSRRGWVEFSVPFLREYLRENHPWEG